MLQSIYFQRQAAFATGALTTYFQLPYRCTVRNIKGIVQADPGDAETVTVTSEPTVGGSAVDIGVLTFGTTIAAGAVGVWVADATTGETVLEEGTFLKFVTTAATAAAVLDLDIELDPLAREKY